MLDFLGIIVTTTLMVLAVNALITFMDIPRSAKLTLATVIGLWIGLSAAVASAGMLAISAWPCARETMRSQLALQ
jgi:hypothetical protein